MTTKTILTLVLIAALSPSLAAARSMANPAGQTSLCKEDPALCDLVAPKEALTPLMVDLSMSYSPTDSAQQRLAAVERLAVQPGDVTRRQEIQLSLIAQHDPDWRVVDAVTKIRREPPSYFKSLLRDKLESLFSKSAKPKLFWLPMIFSERNRLMNAAQTNEFLRRSIEVLWVYEKNEAARALLTEIGSPAIYKSLRPHPLSRAFIPQERQRQKAWWPYAGKRCEKMFDFTS